MARKICIAVDDSAVSKDAVDWATKTLLRPDDELHLVAVLEPLVRSEYTAAAEGAAPLERDENCKPDPLALERTQKFLKQCIEDAEAKGIKDIRATTLVSCVGGSVDTGRHIVDYTREKDTDMLLLGSRGFGSLKRAVLGFIGLGSVSSYVVKHADCNVIVHKVPAGATN